MLPINPTIIDYIDDIVSEQILQQEKEVEVSLIVKLIMPGLKVQFPPNFRMLDFKMFNVREAQSAHHRFHIAMKSYQNGPPATKNALCNFPYNHSREQPSLGT